MRILWKCGFEKSAFKITIPIAFSLLPTCSFEYDILQNIWHFYRKMLHGVYERHNKVLQNNINKNEAKTKHSKSTYFLGRGVNRESFSLKLAMVKAYSS